MAKNNQHDVAIIGGGLAGLALAIQCADAGHDVVLFEKETYPFHKVCGEYISMESWNFLESLKVPLSQLNLPVITLLETSDTSGKLYTFNLPLGGFGISRFMLDNLLFDIAVSKGVKVHTSTKVTNVEFEHDHFKITTVDTIYKSTVAAGAFGKRSNIDVKLNRSFTKQKPNKLNNYIGVKYHVQYPQAAHTISLHNFQDGYCGISQIEGDKCCLCYLTTASNLQHNKNSIQIMEQNVLWKNPKLKEIFSDARFLYEQPLVISQVNFNSKTQLENHVLMLGDSAGLITPLCGNGMSMALHAGKMAFTCIDRFLRKEISRQLMEQKYCSTWKATFAKRVWVGKKVQQLFGAEKSTALFLKTMDAVPALAKLVMRSTHGKPF